MLPWWKEEWSLQAVPGSETFAAEQTGLAKWAEGCSLNLGEEGWLNGQSELSSEHQECVGSMKGCWLE